MNMTRVLPFILIILSTTQAYRILCVFPVPFASHSLMAKYVVQALLEAGHEVTLATPYIFRQRPENLTFINVNNTIRLLKDVNMADPSNGAYSVLKRLGWEISKSTLNNKRFRRAMIINKFDAVITDWFYSDLMAGLAAVQRAPWILVSSTIMYPYLEHIMDEVKSLVTLPIVLSDNPVPMTFWQRAGNFATCVHLMGWDLWDKMRAEAFYEDYFRSLAKDKRITIPSYDEALYNVSVLFVNSHPAIVPARSLPPNVVDITGIHISDEVPRLPKYFQEIMDSATAGVVYFSMGSAIKSTSMSLGFVYHMIKMLSEMSFTVLWKFEDDISPVHKNIYVAKWMPQQGILAHPNLKAFVTHAGMLSIIEATHYGVPVITIPVYGDQLGNAARAVRAGYAIRVGYSSTTVTKLETALREIMMNNSYSLRAKKMSQVFRNRLISPKKLVSHYVELAIKTKGAHHLRSPARFYTWYEKWLLDVIILAIVLHIGIRYLRKFLVMYINYLVEVNKHAPPPQSRKRQVAGREQVRKMIHRRRATNQF